MEITVALWAFGSERSLHFLRCLQVDSRELVDARWFSSHDVRLMLSGQHPDGFFCPPSQAIAHQLIKHSLTRMSKL